MNSKQILQALDATDENLLQEVDRIRTEIHRAIGEDLGILK